jgi:hypothetical protein
MPACHSPEAFRERSRRTGPRVPFPSNAGAQDETRRDACSPNDRVLHDLVGNVAYRTCVIPRNDRATQTASPATELIDVGAELEQMRTRAAHATEALIESTRARYIVGQAGNQRQRENRGRDFRCATVFGNRNHPIEYRRAVRSRKRGKMRDVFDRERTFRRVVRSALATEDKETINAFEWCDCIDVTACAVANLRFARVWFVPVLRPRMSVRSQDMMREPPFIASKSSAGKWRRWRARSTR